MPLVDKETFSYWVTHPEDLTTADFRQLQESLDVYPYCQSLYTLTAKAASLHQKSQTVPYVRRAAAHALSRNALRKLIDNEFQWSDNLLLKLNELASRQVPIPDDYRHESYALFRNKMGIGGSIQFPLLQLPRLIFGDPALLDPPTLRPPIDDPTVTEEALQADLALDEQQVTAEEAPDNSPRPAGDRQKLQLEIIENFIRNEPRIAPVRGKLIDPAEQEDLAQRSQSTVPTGTLVTESFAKILARQGKYDKAVEIYEKLSLRNPEKTAYFAVKISELQGNLKEEQPASNR
jgi:tetratricopeptide (TPR) repeat protein